MLRNLLPVAFLISCASASGDPPCYVIDTAKCKDFESLFGYQEIACKEIECEHQGMGEYACDSTSYAYIYHDNDIEFYYDPPGPGESGTTSFVEDYTDPIPCVTKVQCNQEPCPYDEVNEGYYCKLTLDQLANATVIITAPDLVPTGNACP